ncbi:MAG: hypothetical protein K9N09_01150 [Candidatus Cloacimonetes bacterium]|nr:hypothetical protein [Candidatus Cloacimonadota bacterium]MCF7812987.1 hypothetical protein [Candidatus Cloacimonadota bacterium]MCF7867281.1 hypothetical protein [Candidatus Cloacimonadota bacterium]MCF7882725.1 hypothetical protein [Candidatus Cloacimonadota bacterium]
MKNLLVVCFILIFAFPLFSQSSSEQSVTEQQVEMVELLYDTFEDNSEEWPLGDNEDYLLKIENGKLIFRHKNTEGSYYIWQWSCLNGDEPFLIESTMNHTAGAENYGFGLLWGLDNAENYFTFNITDNGYYRIGRKKEGEWHAYVDWTQSSRINTNGIRNSLQLEKEGDKIKFYINGSYVDQIDFETIFADGVGFVIWGDQTIEIDHLTVKGSGDWEWMMEDLMLDY